MNHWVSPSVSVDLGLNWWLIQVRMGATYMTPVYPKDETLKNIVALWGGIGFRSLIHDNFAVTHSVLAGATWDEVDAPQWIVFVEIRPAELSWRLAKGLWINFVPVSTYYLFYFGISTMVGLSWNQPL